MATAKKLPSGSWRCLVYDYTDENGKRIYRSFTSDDPSPAGKRKAEALAAQYAAEKEQKKRSSDKSLFSDRMESYITSKEAVLSPATIRGYRNIQKCSCATMPHSATWKSEKSHRMMYRG